jgi:hypothetical protein
MEIVGQCQKNGQQEIKYAKRTDTAACTGGYIPPPSVNASCDRCLPAYLESSWSACQGGIQRMMFNVKEGHAGCVDDGSAELELREEYKAQKIATNRTCREVEVRLGANGFTLTVAIVLAVVLVLVAALVVAFCEFDKLNRRYVSLAQANARMDGEEMDDANEIETHVQDDVEERNARDRLSSAPVPSATRIVPMPTIAAGTKPKPDDTKPDDTKPRSPTNEGNAQPATRPAPGSSCARLNCAAIDSSRI